MNEDTVHDRRAAVSRRARYTGRPSRARPLSDAARTLRTTKRDPHLGPYETRYVVQDGYSLDRSIIRP